MQILPRMPLGRVNFEKARSQIDSYLDRIVVAINHNAKEREFTRRTRTPVDARVYDIEIIHVPRRIVAVNAILLSGTCDVVITHGSTDIVWKTAGSATLSLSSTMVSDTVESGGDVPENTLMICTTSNVSSALNMILTLRTGG